MEDHRSFLPLLVVIFLAFAVPLLLTRVRRLRLPIVVGEILAGIIVGRSGFNWVPAHDTLLDLLAEFGFVFLMFLSGMEIDFSSFGLSRGPQSKEQTRWSPLQLGGLSFLLTLALSTAVGFGLLSLGLIENPWMMALILSTTSLGVVMPVLKERGLIAGRFGQTILIAALIADFATMLLITLLVAVLSSGLTFEILLIGWLFVAFFLMYRLGIFFFRRLPGVRRAFEELSHASAQIKVRAAFALMLMFVVLSDTLGTEIILGAFLAGAIVALLRTPEDVDLGHKLEAIGFGFFIPIFFIKVGIDFNLAALSSSPQSLVLVPLLLAAAFAVKFLPALVFRLTFGMRETLAAAALTSARLSLIIAASAIGLRLGVIGESVNAAIILVAIITVTVAPLLFVRLAPQTHGGEMQPIVVIGASDLGLHVVEQLRAHSEPTILLDAAAERVERARQRGHEAILLPPLEANGELGRYLQTARSVVCTYTDIDLNYEVCRLARTVYGVEHVVARVNTPSDLARFQELGVVTLNAALDHAMLLGLLARNPAAFALMTRTDDDKEVYEVIIGDERYAGARLKQLELPGDVLALALRRNGELLVPHSDTQLELGDHLTLMGSIEYMDTARQLFASRAYS